MKQSMWAFLNSPNQKIDIATLTCAGKAMRWESDLLNLFAKRCKTNTKIGLNYFYF